ncbi:MAG: coproporphyrinogen dehydrogenase HemZ [Lachnospiraceae bacterium]|nr:coproporphyrinogen dehydrogenase HemZ [Lachnospiraceae bacterium]
MYVFLNSPGYSYDVHSLVKAFYPGEDVKIVYDMPEKEYISVYVSSGDIKKDDRASGIIRVTAFLTDDTVAKEDRYDDLTRSDIKNILKRTLYAVLSEVTGKKLPWGTMTGIRPVKVPMKLIRQGGSDDHIASYMRSVYLCSDEKIKLATGIAHREADIIDSLSGNGFGLYIGIPFCPTTCMYCSFSSYPIAMWKGRTDEYLDALKKELDMYSLQYSGRCADAVYIGGGTPTTLSADQLADLIGYVRMRFDLSKLREFTVEAGRPDSITDEKLRTLKQNGVDRISINPQTMNQATLDLIGRRHTVEDVYTAFDKARNAGFSNINMDLIIGLPGEDETDVSCTFDRIRELGPDSLTVHSLAIKRAAAMAGFLEDHPDITSTNTPEMMKAADECARSLDLKPYYLYRQKNMSGNLENVGYAREGCFGIYNVIIMEETEDIAAAGAATIAKRVFANDRIERFANVKDVKLYIERIDETIERKKAWE